MDIELYNDDCFNVFPQIEEKSVDLFVLDLPYNQTACSWDKDIIPLDKMWEHIKRIMKPNGIVIHFCTAKFGYRLIHSNPKWFRYDLIWKKSRKVGFLSANKMPLRQHENIYLFKPEGGTYNPQKTEGKPYKNQKVSYSNSYYREGRGGSKKEYKNKGTENKGDRYPSSIIEHENMYVFKPEQGTYNPQKTKGKPYFRAEHNYVGDINDAYGMNNRTEHSNPSGDRHPTSIIDHENLYVFSDACNDDLDISRNKDLRQYAQKVKDYIGKNRNEISKDLGDCGFHHFYSKGVQFGIPTETTYNKVIELYKLDEMPEFIPYKTLNKIWIEHNETTYNPQKTEGTPYKNGAIPNKNNVYGTSRDKGTITKTDRHPSSLIDYDGDSILVYKNPHKTIHRTQKPVELCEWLIKTYSNEGDTVMDFTMGSGTVAVAAMNTKRKFIGVEKDPVIYEKAEQRLADLFLT